MKLAKAGVLADVLRDAVRGNLRDAVAKDGPKEDCKGVPVDSKVLARRFAPGRSYHRC